MYVILRCPNSKTGTLLRWAGEKVCPGALWTPFFKRRRRLPRSRKTQHYRVPALPGYLFCPHDLYLQYRVTFGHQGLRPLSDSFGRLVYCSREELEILRDHVEKGTAADVVLVAAREPTFVVGDLVNVAAEHPWLFGRAGRVVAQRPGVVLVDFGGLFGTTAISPFLLGKA